MPSNTLTCLYGLTEDVRKGKVLGEDLIWEIKLIDESVQKVEIKKIIKESQKSETKVIVCLVGVQSNQFSRASDIALELRKNNIAILIGGFHISGSFSVLLEPSPEIQKLIDNGVTVIAGEAEDRWGAILQDAIEDKLKPLYNFLLEPPDIRFAPMPLINKEYLKHFISSNFATLDCGRGCPFNCSFCTVVNVHGRMMRTRDVNKIMDLLRENYHKHKISFYFFTDDNFCRNKNWESIFDNLIKLRQEENIPIEFMIQVDTQSYKIPHFIERAKQSGCKHVFIGLESLNSQNLQSVGKKQNHTEEFKELISAYRKFDIDTHIAYIIGFPFDTTSSVKEDIKRLKSEISPEQASFFIMTPLPGSRDHLELIQKGKNIDLDLNKYDSFHVTMQHPSMTGDELMSAYKDAWLSFYSLENMETILKKVSKQNYWDVFMKFLFYKNAVFIENEHPMLGGIIRLKDRLQRRPGFPIDPLIVHLKKRANEFFYRIKNLIKLLLEMEELWLRTRPRSILEQNVVKELLERYQYTKQWRDLKLVELKSAYCKALIEIMKTAPNIGLLKKLVIPRNLWLKKHNIFSQSLTYSRKSFTDFWNKTQKQISKVQFHRISICKLASTMVQESLLFVNFLYSFLSWLVPHLFRNVPIFRNEKKLITVEISPLQ